MKTLYKPEKVFHDPQPVPADVEAFFPKLRLIRDQHGGLTALELDRAIKQTVTYFQRGETRRGRGQLWKTTLAVCAWALANQHRVRRKKAAGWVPMGDSEKHQDLTHVRGVYNLLRGCMLQSALVWDDSGEVATPVSHHLQFAYRGRARLTLRVRGERAVLRCGGFTASTDLMRGWGLLSMGSFCTLTPPTPLRLEQTEPTFPVDQLVVRPAALLSASVTGGGARRPDKYMRIASLGDVEVPYRWDPFGQHEAPMVRKGRLVRYEFTGKEYRPARRGYGTRLYRLAQSQRVCIGSSVVVV